MPKSGNKFATLHQFGKKRKRSKKSEPLSKPTTADTGASDAPATEVTAISQVASAKKLRFFSEEAGQSTNTSSDASDINIIVNLPTLKQLFSSIQCETEDCGGSVSTNFDYSFVRTIFVNCTVFPIVITWTNNFRVLNHFPLFFSLQFLKTAHPGWDQHAT